MVFDAYCFGNRVFYWFVGIDVMVDTLKVLPYAICVIIFIIVLWNEWVE